MRAGKHRRQRRVRAFEAKEEVAGGVGRGAEAALGGDREQVAARLGLLGRQRLAVDAAPGGRAEAGEVFVAAPQAVLLHRFGDPLRRL